MRDVSAVRSLTHSRKENYVLRYKTSAHSTFQEEIRSLSTGRDQQCSKLQALVLDGMQQG